VGRLDLQCDVVLSVASGQRLVLLRAQPGTGTAERLDVLRAVGTQTIEAAAFPAEAERTPLQRS
jgi:hypothetical protein